MQFENLCNYWEVWFLGNDNYDITVSNHNQNLNWFLFQNRFSIEISGLQHFFYGRKSAPVKLPESRLTSESAQVLSKLELISVELGDLFFLGKN